MVPGIQKQIKLESGYILSEKDPPPPRSSFLALSFSFLSSISRDSPQEHPSDSSPFPASHVRKEMFVFLTDVGHRPWKKVSCRISPRVIDYASNEAVC